MEYPAFDANCGASEKRVLVDLFIGLHNVLWDSVKIIVCMGAREVLRSGIQTSVKKSVLLLPLIKASRKLLHESELRLIHI